MARLSRFQKTAEMRRISSPATASRSMIDARVRSPWRSSPRPLERARAAPDQGRRAERRAPPDRGGDPECGGDAEDASVGGDLHDHASGIERRRGSEDLPGELRGEHGGAEGQSARKRAQPHDSTSVTLNLWYTEWPGASPAFLHTTGSPLRGSSWWSLSFPRVTTGPFRKRTTASWSSSPSSQDSR